MFCSSYQNHKISNELKWKLNFYNQLQQGFCPNFLFGMLLQFCSCCKQDFLNQQSSSAGLSSSAAVLSLWNPFLQSLNSKYFFKGPSKRSSPLWNNFSFWFVSNYVFKVVVFFSLPFVSLFLSPCLSLLALPSWFTEGHWVLKARRDLWCYLAQSATENSSPPDSAKDRFFKEEPLQFTAITNNTMMSHMEKTLKLVLFI